MHQVDTTLPAPSIRRRWKEEIAAAPDRLMVEDYGGEQGSSPQRSVTELTRFSGV